MLNLITSSDMKMLCTVDYVTTRLVNDSVELMQDIIEKCLSKTTQIKATSLLTSVSFSSSTSTQSYVPKETISISMDYIML